MLFFLARRLIPNCDQTASPPVRTAYGALSGAFGIALNVLLCLGKLVAGMISGSIAITADAFNNLSDAGSSLISMIGFKLSAKKPDPGHPFGHGRIEYVAGLLVSLVIILMGVELFKTSIGKISSPKPVTFSLLSAGILLASMAVKLYMYSYNKKLGRMLESPALEATATDCRSDVLSTAVVLIAMVLSHFTGLHIDGWAGLMVSAAILWAGYSAARDTINPLLGQSPDPELVRSIQQQVLSAPEVIGIHDMIIHDYGPGRRIVSLHVEVSADGDILLLHDAVDRLEHQLMDTLNCETVIHMDPIVTDDALVSPLRTRIAVLLQESIDPALQIHDFRIVTGPSHTNVIFDAVAPFDFRMSDEALKEEITRLVREMDPSLYAVVCIDHA